MIRQVNEPLARVVADLLKRHDPDKAAQWIQEFKQQDEAREICENNLAIMGEQQGEE